MPDKSTKLFPGALWDPSSDSETGAKRFEYHGSSMRRFIDFLEIFGCKSQEKMGISYNVVITGSVFTMPSKCVDLKCFSGYLLLL